ncbi:MAG TPA: hypothetical protein VGA80_13525 [Flavobacteriaceae bacterium]
MTAKLFWEIGATLQMLIGIAHFIGTYYTQLLHPKDNNLIEQMKNTILNVDNKATQWNAWIFFNLSFGICLFIVGFFSFVLAYQNFEIVSGFSFYSICILICSCIIIYFAQRFTIRKVRTAFLIITVFYIISILISQ